MKDRHDIPSLLAHDSICAELGVAAGQYSNIILSYPQVSKLYSIDSWNTRGHQSPECTKASKLLSKYSHRSIVIRDTFSNALKEFDDEYFDFIYIDGYADSGQENGKTLRDWYPKLKRGGVFAGHDYHEQWRPTMDAVDEFCRLVGKTPEIIPGNPADNAIFPSWLIIK
jgi:predicted O-methyltransferase YrrM